MRSRYNVVVRIIDSHRASAVLGLKGIYNCEFIGRIFMRHRNRAIAAEANPVPGSKRFASTPVPMGTVPTTLPVFPSTNAIILLWQPTTNLSFFASMAKPDGSSHGANGQVFRTVRVLESISTSELFIFQIREDVALFIGGCEFRPATQLHRSGDFASLGINRSGAICLPAGGEKRARSRIVNYGVGAFVGLRLAEVFSVFMSNTVAGCIVRAVAREAVIKIRAQARSRGRPAYSGYRRPLFLSPGRRPSRATHAK